MRTRADLPDQWGSLNTYLADARSNRLIVEGQQVGWGHIGLRGTLCRLEYPRLRDSWEPIVMR